MEIEIIAILITGLLNLIATLRQSRCTELKSECCFGLLSVDLERQVEEERKENII